MGQVSLPVLSRKRANDYWNYNWASKKNYNINFNEDIFLKKFLFMFIMYGISKNKHFVDIFFKNKLSIRNVNVGEYNLLELDNKLLFKQLNNCPRNIYFISNIFLCRLFKWVFVYLYTYSITNVKKDNLNKKIKLNFKNDRLFYQTYLYCKSGYKIIFLKKIYQ